MTSPRHEPLETQSPAESPDRRIQPRPPRVAAFWRWTFGFLVIVGLVITIVVAHYQDGGGRLSVQPLGGISGPVNVGEEFHTFIHLATGGEEVTLLKAEPVVADHRLRADLRLVRGPRGRSIASWRGPLGEPYEVMPLKGHSLKSDDHDEVDYWLDLRMVPSAPGIHAVTAVEVSYRAGFLRDRTARADTWVCMSASTDWRSDHWRSDERDCPYPEPPG